MTDATPSSTGLSAYRRGVALVLLGSLSSSWIGLGIRLMDQASAWQILVFRSAGMMALLLAFIAWRNPGRLVAVFRGAGLPALVGGIGLATAFSASILAIQQASVANAVFLLAASPFVAALIGRLLLKERVRPATWIAIVCAAAGVITMVAEGLSFGYLWGNVAGLIASLGLAVFILALRWGRQRDMLPVNVIAGGIGLAVALLLCFATGDGLAVTLHDGLLGLAMGVFQLGLGLILITLGSRTVSAAELALLTLAEVVLAPLWVWLVLGETAGHYTLLGGALVVAAIAGDALTGLRARRLATSA